MQPLRRTRPVAVAAAVAVVGLALGGVAGCGGGDDADGPLVDRIDEAIDAVDAYYGEPQDFVEVSATGSIVALIVARDGTDEVEQAFWSPDDGLVDPVAIGAMARPTFTGEQVAFDPDTVLERVSDELPDAEISDFAVTATADGAVIYDARLVSDQGGVLLVLLAPDGRVLGVQAE